LRLRVAHTRGSGEPFYPAPRGFRAARNASDGVGKCCQSFEVTARFLRLPIPKILRRVRPLCIRSIRVSSRAPLQGRKLATVRMVRSRVALRRLAPGRARRWWPERRAGGRRLVRSRSLTDKRLGSSLWRMRAKGGAERMGEALRPSHSMNVSGTPRLDRTPSAKPGGRTRHGPGEPFLEFFVTLTRARSRAEPLAFAACEIR
jgi:hypothetical protein